MGSSSIDHALSRVCTSSVVTPGNPDSAATLEGMDAECDRFQPSNDVQAVRIEAHVATSLPVAISRPAASRAGMLPELHRQFLSYIPVATAVSGAGLVNKQWHASVKDPVYLAQSL